MAHAAGFPAVVAALEEGNAASLRKAGRPRAPPIRPISALSAPLKTDALC